MLEWCLNHIEESNAQYMYIKTQAATMIDQIHADNCLILIYILIASTNREHKKNDKLMRMSIHSLVWLSLVRPISGGGGGGAPALWLASGGGAGIPSWSPPPNPGIGGGGGGIIILLLSVIWLGNGGGGGGTMALLSSIWLGNGGGGGIAMLSESSLINGGGGGIDDMSALLWLAAVGCGGRWLAGVCCGGR